MHKGYNIHPIKYVYYRPRIFISNSETLTWYKLKDFLKLGASSVGRKN